MMNHTPVKELNVTPASEFFMLGFSNHPEFQSTFFIFLLLIYLIALLGNLLIMTTIIADTHLHTPMYFFLGNLAILDICCASSIIPKMLESLASKARSISYSSCITQLFLLVCFLSTELLMLACMAFDRYVAICNPLHYSRIMSIRFCIITVATMWCVGLVSAITLTLLITRLSFCGRITLDHFFCEIPPILKVSSSDTRIIGFVIFAADMFFGMFCFLLIVLSYTCILSSIAKICSATNKRKVFSTCSSHLMVVTLFYGGIFYAHIRPALNATADKDKVVSLIYAIVSPLMNPIIYSLRNQEVKAALMKMLSSKM
ncbi:olfactory receptor 5V1-like [Pleurodeles waltl]|uniref:olfactory receptor 5V1-like n=1 Tax=Pleurodeles waltl TaxID=8319 RepID=UPI0037094DF1